MRRGGGVGSYEVGLLPRGTVLRVSWSSVWRWLELLVGEAKVKIGRLVEGECGMTEGPVSAGTVMD